MSQMNEVFEKVVSRFDADKMAGVTATVQFNLTGGNSGEYYLAIAGGSCNYGQGAAENPTATITIASEDLTALTAGQLNPMAAFMQGKIKVQGDMGVVMKMQNLLSGN